MGRAQLARRISVAWPERFPARGRTVASLAPLLCAAALQSSVRYRSFCLRVCFACYPFGAGRPVSPDIIIRISDLRGTLPNAIRTGLMPPSGISQVPGQAYSVENRNGVSQHLLSIVYGVIFTMSIKISRFYPFIFTKHGGGLFWKTQNGCNNLGNARKQPPLRHSKTAVQDFS